MTKTKLEEGNEKYEALLETLKRDMDKKVTQIVDELCERAKDAASGNDDLLWENVMSGVLVPHLVDRLMYTAYFGAMSMAYNHNVDVDDVCDFCEHTSEMFKEMATENYSRAKAATLETLLEAALGSASKLGAKK